jgi:hypothetical protein
MIMKGKVLSVIVLLLLASSLTLVASASPTKTPFYVKTLTTSITGESHQADDSRLLYKATEEGIIEDAGGLTLGTFVFEVTEGVDMKTGIGTASGHFVFSFETGETIEGTMIAKLHMYAPPTPPDVNGKFVGHGDKHVMGDLYLVIEGTNAFTVFDGCSW